MHLGLGSLTENLGVLAVNIAAAGADESGPLRFAVRSTPITITGSTTGHAIAPIPDEKGRWLALFPGGLRVQPPLHWFGLRHRDLGRAASPCGGPRRPRVRQRRAAVGLVPRPGEGLALPRTGRTSCSAVSRASSAPRNAFSAALRACRSSASCSWNECALRSAARACSCAS